MKEYFKYRLLYAILLWINVFVFVLKPLLTNAQETSAPHFESWKIGNITGRTRSPVSVIPKVDSGNTKISQYKFFYAISSANSFVDWVNPDTKDWTMFSDSSSNLAYIQGNWRQYNDKYLFVKGEAYYRDGKVEISTYLTPNSSKHIDSMYMIPYMQKEPAPGIDPDLKIETLTDKTHVYVQFYDVPKKWQKASELGIHLMNPGDGIYFTATLPVKRIEEIIKDKAIRYIGPVLFEAKLSLPIRENNIRPWAVNVDGTVNLWIGFYMDVAKEEAERLLRNYNLQVKSMLQFNDGDYEFLVYNVPKEKIVRIVTEDIVRYVDIVSPPPVPSLNYSGPRINADDVHNSPYNLDGTGIDVMVMDSGRIDSTHPDFGAPTRVSNVDDEATSTSDHATRVSGIIGEATSPYNGIAPNVDIIGYDSNDDRADWNVEYAEAIATYSVKVANNSWDSTIVWGSTYSCYLMGYYDDDTKLFDEIVRGATYTPILVAFAAGNDRNHPNCGFAPGDINNNYDTVPTPASAKNIITVGATDSNDDSMSGYPYSSWGPMDDGRLKPDVVAPGCEWMDGITAAKTPFPPYYTYSCGTSYASPHVTGALALMLQYYQSTHGTATTPLPSTLKGVLIHTAQDLNPDTATDTHYRFGPDYASGYGIIDVLKAIQWIQKDNATDGIYILEGKISENATDTFSFRVPSGQSEVKVTVVWDDEPGMASSTKHLRNDIDIILTDPNSNIKYSWSLDPDHASNTATHNGLNTIDNVEQVYATGPTAGIWKLSVAGRDFYNDSATQSYSIVTDFPLGEPKHAIWDSASNAVAIFGYDGNLYLKGTLADYATSGCLTPTAAAEFIIQTATDTTKTIINSSTGNMCIAGGINENQTSIISPEDRPDFIVQDKDSNNLSLISNAGDLYLKGEIYQKAIP